MHKMENDTVVLEKVQTIQSPQQAFRWSKWVDGNGRLFIVWCFGGYHFQPGPVATKLSLIDVDHEVTIDMAVADFKTMIETGQLKRVEGPILI